MTPCEFGNIGGTNDLVFDATDVDQSALGWIVQVSPLLAQLWQQLHLHATSNGPLSIVLGQVQNIVVPVKNWR